MRKLALTIIVSGLIAMSGCGAVLNGMSHMAYRQGKLGPAHALRIAGHSARHLEQQQLSPSQQFERNLAAAALFGFLGAR